MKIKRFEELNEKGEVKIPTSKNKWVIQDKDTGEDYGDVEIEFDKNGKLIINGKTMTEDDMDYEQKGPYKVSILKNYPKYPPKKKKK